MDRSGARLVTILTPCRNERENVRPLHEAVAAVMASLPDVDWAHLFVDNASTDGTQAELRAMASGNGRIRAILNQRNFGQVRSPYYGLLQAAGDAVIVMAADFQDPPALIPQFIQKWKAGFRVVVGQKIDSRESGILYAARTAYYRLVRRMADVELLENVTGFGLYDRTAIEAFRALDDPYPYVRGLIAELGFPTAVVPYTQPRRRRGLTKNNFYSLYDMAMLGITSHSKVPLRLATMLGFASSLACFAIGLAYLVYKLIFWNRFPLGTAPVVIGLFFFASVQLLFIGVIGEYIGAIHTRVSKRPLVLEAERINF